jgi:hypothetical protein
MNHHGYAHLIFGKDAKNIQPRKNSHLTNVAGKTG